MPLNLIALCGPPGDPTVRRIRTSAPVQAQLETLFEVLEIQFRDGIDHELPYDSRWTPGPEELATLQETAEATHVLAQINAGVLTLQELDVAQFDDQQIRALAVARGAPGGDRVLFQAFSAAQRLSRRFALLLSGNTFDKLDRPAFSLTHQIDLVAEGGLLKFKKFNMAKRVFDLSQSYREATDNEIQSFCALPVVDGDADQLLA